MCGWVYVHCFTDDVTLRLRRVNKQRKRERRREGGKREGCELTLVSFIFQFRNVPHFHKLTEGCGAVINDRTRQRKGVQTKTWWGGCTVGEERKKRPRLLCTCSYSSMVKFKIRWTQESNYWSTGGGLFLFLEWEGSGKWNNNMWCVLVHQRKQNKSQQHVKTVKFS